MTNKLSYVEESREAITRSVVNKSTSKNLWTFSKDQRFKNYKPECPYASYITDLSTINKRNTQFGSSRRKVFTQTSDAPSSWAYNPQLKQNKSSSTFGQGRDKCVANSYIPLDPVKNPGPGRYLHELQDRKRGYSMRPKTAYGRDYFIEDIERRQVPSPFNYHVNTERDGRSTLSKFRSTIMGSVGMKTTNDRFKQYAEPTPSPSMYMPKKNGINKYSKGGKMNCGARLSFIDQVSKSAYTPGPGNYRMPTEFAHYNAPH